MKAGVPEDSNLESAAVVAPGSNDALRPTTPAQFGGPEEDPGPVRVWSIAKLVGPVCEGSLIRHVREPVRCYTRGMSASMSSPRDAREDHAIRRWAGDRAAASSMEARGLLTTSSTPARSFAAALSLLDLYVRLHGWPPRVDPVDQREDFEMWSRFARLRSKVR